MHMCIVYYFLCFTCFCCCGKIVLNRGSLANFVCPFIRFPVLYLCISSCSSTSSLRPFVPDRINVNVVEISSGLCLFVFKWLA
uniref:Putative secreted protein n=1 Tax=Panstrongylus lignarius TaxID=156445 RepID=A0A224XSK1_9HEMI